MRVSNVRQQFQSLIQLFFPKAIVAFANQSRQPKGSVNPALILITHGNVKRPNQPVCEIIDGEPVANYHSRISMTIDLFSKGTPVKDENDEIFAYEDTTVDDLLALIDFINSEYTLNWCSKHDISISVEGDVHPLTGIVNDTSYEYRARVVFLIYFTQKAIGFAPVFSEDSIKYPTGYFDEFGNPIFSTERPEATESVTGYTKDETGDLIIDKVIDDSPGTGGRNEDLANEDVGYFTQVEITEEETEDE